jgi:hypothetical protein
MKTIFKSSLVLLLFSVSLVLFNLSCSKESVAQPTTPQNVGLIVFVKVGDNSNNFWTAKYDGTGATKVTIASFPAQAETDEASFQLSPDGKKVFFLLYIPSTQIQSIYSCNVDGTGLTQVVSDVDEIGNVI